jgi:hypothetical protein
MTRSLTRGFQFMAVLGLAASLGLASSAYALFPPPFYYPPVVPKVVPAPPAPPPPVIDIPPPPSPPCHGPMPHVTTTPEPATMVSALVGASMLGGYVLRRRRK